MFTKIQIEILLTQKPARIKNCTICNDIPKNITKTMTNDLVINKNNLLRVAGNFQHWILYEKTMNNFGRIL